MLYILNIIIPYSFKKGSDNIKKSYIIFHIDLNSFFASCEIAENPLLRGKKLAIAHSEIKRKSIILTSSYEARKYGVRTAMSIEDALKLCPDLTIVRPRMEVYQHYSELFFEYLKEISDLIEPASIDECYLDVTQNCETEDALVLAQRIQNELLTKYQMPVSIGIGPNKFLAKMASDMKKPLGITILRKREIQTKLWPLPVEKLFGVGEKTLPLLTMLKIKTIGDLARFSDDSMLEEVLGPNTSRNLKNSSLGIGSPIVDVNRYYELSSMSSARTFDQDEYLIDNLKLELQILVNTLSHRLEKKHLLAKTLSIQIKYSDFSLISRSRTLINGTNNNHLIYRHCLDLFLEHYDSDQAVRLLGVMGSKLIKEEDELKQMSIFDDLDEEEKNHQLNKLLTNLQSNFGKDIIKRGIKDE